MEPVTHFVAWMILGAFWTYYVTQVLLLEEKDSHYGPFPSNKRRVNWSQTIPTVLGPMFRDYSAPVTVFDWIRRIFRVYAIEKEGDGYEIWHVIDARAEVWTCPRCLSFWVALIPTFGYVLSGSLGIEVLFMPSGLAGLSYFLMGRSSTLVMAQTETTEEEEDEQ